MGEAFLIVLIPGDAQKEEKGVSPQAVFVIQGEVLQGFSELFPYRIRCDCEMKRPIFYKPATTLIFLFYNHTTFITVSALFVETPPFLSVPTFLGHCFQQLDFPRKQESP